MVNDVNDDTAQYRPTGATEPVTRQPVTRRHATPMTLALGLWVAALALGITIGALTDSSPAGLDAQRPETVVGGPEDLQATATTPSTTRPSTTTQPSTSLPPATTPPTGPEDSDDSGSEGSGGSSEDGGSDTVRCDAAQAAAEQAQAAVDGVHETLLELAEAEQAAADAETQAEQACSGGSGDD
jgi:hypothetical protein